MISMPAMAIASVFVALAVVAVASWHYERMPERRIARRIARLKCDADS